MTPATTTRPRWERRKQDRPAELLAAALELFVERGFAGTRLDDVATRAGVSKGTLYLYFENKEELFKEVVRHSVVARISRAREQAAAWAGSNVDLVAAQIEQWWRDFGSTQAGGITKLMMAESGNFPEIARFYLEEVIEPWHALLGQTLARGIARGEFRTVDIPSHVRVITAPLVMLALWSRSFGPCSAEPLDPEAYLAATIAMVRAALAPARA